MEKKEELKPEISPEKKEGVKDEELELEKRLMSIGSDKETEIMAKIGEMKRVIRGGEEYYGGMISKSNRRDVLTNDFRRLIELKKTEVGWEDITIWVTYGKIREALRGASIQEEIRTDDRIFHTGNAIKYSRLGGYLKREWIVKKLENLGKEHPQLAKVIHDTLRLPEEQF